MAESDTNSVVEEMSSVVADAQEMLKRANNESGDRARELRAQVESKLLKAKLRLQEIHGQALDRGRAAARVTDDYVHENAWQALGAAALIGLLIGIAVGRSGGSGSD